MNTKARSKATHYFHSLRPSLEASDAEIKAFETFITQLESMRSLSDGDERLKGWINDTIADLKSKKIARDLSA
jgi:hypothetical protein